ncbi:hypothetical protein Plhal304r1_c031g0101301 [Plasmopara halstedii]
MLNSMFFSPTMLTTLTKSGVKPEEYFQQLVCVYDTAATSSKSEIMSVSQQNSKKFDVALQYLEYALVADGEMNTMTFDDRIKTLINSLSEKMPDISDQRSKDFLHNKMKQLGPKLRETEHELPPVS